MDSFAPKYIQIYEAIRSDIILQKYAANSFLPTEKQLMDHYSAGRSTIRRALSMLQEEGFIRAQQGSGSRVLPLPGSDTRTFDLDRWQRMRASAQSQFSPEYHLEGSVTHTPAVVDVVPAPQAVTEALGLNPNEAVYRAQRVWMIGSESHSYMYMLQYVRCDIMPGLERFADTIANLYNILQTDYGLNFIDGEEHISAINAGFIEANILNVEIGSALLFTYRIANCERGPFEYAEFYANPKLNGYKLLL